MSMEELPRSETPLGPEAVSKNATAAQVMNPRPRSCSPHSSVTEAVLIFKDEDCGFVPIIEDERAIGVLTDRDVALGLARFSDLASRPVSDIMTTEIISVGPDTPIHEVCKTFIDHDVRRLLVMESSGKVVGVISWSDIAPWMSYQMTGLMVAETVNEPGS